MVLVVESDSETFLNESDAVYPFEDELARERISEVLGDPERSTCFLTTKNELGS